jgi:hypothetical protein
MVLTSRALSLEEIGTRIVTDCCGSEGEVQVVRSVGNKTKE